MALPIGTPLPSLDGATLWLNTDNTSDPNTGPFLPPEGPVLVHFWAMSCPSCKVNMPGLQALRDKYAPQGLQVVAVHTPRGPFDINPDAVRDMARDLGMTEPCALDDDHAIADRFQTGGVWPIYFVFGKNGKLKVRAAGGFGLKMCEAPLRNVFGEG